MVSVGMGEPVYTVPAPHEGCTGEIVVVVGQE
jgi:hypothetical protein